MKLMGTKFQLVVWNQIKKTAKDKALYYKYIIKRIDKPDACRAVTNAFSKKPLPIKSSCHNFNKKNSVIIGIIVKKNL